MSTTSTSIVRRLGRMFGLSRRPVMREVAGKSSTELAPAASPSSVDVEPVRSSRSMPTMRAMTELLTTIRDSLEANAARQSEMLDLLRELPRTLAEIPQTSRLQAEALSAMSQQTSKMAGAIDYLSGSTVSGREALLSMSKRLEAMRDGDEQLVFTLKEIGSTMGTFADAAIRSTSSTQALHTTLLERDARGRERRGWFGIGRKAA